jgi:hypothetical protein
LREPSGPPHGDRQLAVNDRLTETVVFHVHNCVMHPMATHELQSSASEGSGLDSAIRTAPDPIEPPVEQTGDVPGTANMGRLPSSPVLRVA